MPPLEWQVIPVDTTWEAALAKEAAEPGTILVKVEKDAMGVEVYCALCGAWIRYDPHGADCPYRDLPSSDGTWEYLHVVFDEGV